MFDKTYVRAEGMLFNVTGYNHPVDSVYGSLKYIEGSKWKLGYEAAKSWLAIHHPEFVDKYIQIPRRLITEVFEPRSRWRALCSQPRDNLSPLHQEALELAEALSAASGIDILDFGITDSLLWGDGHELSDIDLVVFGAAHTPQLLAMFEQLYHGDFARPNPELLTAPYSLKVANWPALLDRKLHMGEYRGRFFSLRTVLTESEFHAMGTVPDGEQLSTRQKLDVEFTVQDVSSSLCFPAIYRDRHGNELVDYSVVYEGVFRRGDTVKARCTTEDLQQVHSHDGATRNQQRLVRYIIDGGCQWLDRSS